ncbi:transmembrane protein 26-like [Babylonia areolata]|uniref:transmembrane protein 26-like n=1 Tax=Babylonia areolata TaxID=304850 RepID=UPI003FCF0D33
MASCLKRTRTAIAVFKAVLSRTLFALHGFICIWRVTVIKGQPLYWCLTGTLPVMVLETIFTIRKKKGGEWKWVCPSVFLYLGTAVPAIWFLELDLMKLRMAAQTSTTVSALPLTRDVHEDAISSVLNGQLHLSISLGREEWCKILEQMLLLLLIIGRWLLPKGEITREQLSQLLLVYIGMAADIIELFEAFKEEAVRQNRMLTLIILGLWTASLTQFTFVLTATKAKRSRPGFHRAGSQLSTLSVDEKSCCQTEVLSIVMSMTLQDGPFLVLRMLLILRYDVLSYTNIFFTCKNTLVLVLQFYRLVVLFCQKRHDSSLALKTLEQEATDHVTDRQPHSSGKCRGKGLKKADSASVKFSNGEDTEGTIEDEVFTNLDRSGARRHATKADLVKKTPTTSRREPLRRQGRGSEETPFSSLERGNHPRGTPSTHSLQPPSDAEIQAAKRLKTKAGRRKMSEDSAQGNTSDSREEDLRKARGLGRKSGELRRQRSAKEQWQDVRVLAKSIAFISEAGKYQTLVLKPIKTTDSNVVYVLESEDGSGTMKYG